VQARPVAETGGLGGHTPSVSGQTDMRLWALQRHVIPQTPSLVLVGHTARSRVHGDVADAEGAIDRLAAAPAEEGLQSTCLQRMTSPLFYSRRVPGAYPRLGFSPDRHAIFWPLSPEEIGRGMQNANSGSPQEDWT
jgi:hypothetical protein